VKRIFIILFLLLSSSGCVFVGGYSSDRGLFIWPGTIVIFVIVAILFLLLRRRR
jgi:membrane protein implicated in regulation of membrane protease activity